MIYFGGMMTRKLIFVSVILIAVVPFAAIAQKTTKPAPAQAAKPIIFAVLNDGRSLEPIAYVDKSKLEAPVDGGAEGNLVAAFNKQYYKAGIAYRLVFGGANSGTVTVKGSNAKADCAPNMGTGTTKALKTPLKGFVMALATNVPSKWTAASYRRKPTDAERTEVESLVRAEFTRQKLTPGTLRYHNLTALDIDNDGTAELVGSYWVEIDRLTRGLLFFIASKGSNGKYAFGHKEYRSVDQANVMSGEIKSVDEGVYHELLLDAFDYNGDGVAEIFTYTQSFEGSGFAVYDRDGGKWTKVFDGANYHCGY